MTESSKDKTKRKQLKYLTDYVWVQQTSLFPNLILDDYEYDCELAKVVVIEHLSKFKDKLRKSYNDTAFVVIVRALAKSNDKIKYKYGNKVIHQLYVTIYSSQLIEKDRLQELANNIYGGSAINVSSRRVTTRDLIKACNTINSQKLHNLEILLRDRKPNRYSILNENKLVQRKQSLLIDLTESNVPF